MAPASMSSTLLAFTITSTPSSKKAAPGLVVLSRRPRHKARPEPGPTTSPALRGQSYPRTHVPRWNAAQLHPQAHAPPQAVSSAHLEEFGNLGHVAGTLAFASIGHIFPNLQSTQKRAKRKGGQWSVVLGPRGSPGVAILAPLSPPQPSAHTQLMSTYLGRAAGESLTLQKPYITFWFSK